MDLRHVVETSGEDVRARNHHNEQQQLVRERGRRKAAAELGLARSSSRCRQWGGALGRCRLVVPPTYQVASTGKRQAPKEATTTLDGRGDDEEEDEEEEEVVEEKVALLRRLVPGGDDMAVESLLEETADYIAALEAQVGVMRALACLVSASGSGLDTLPETAAAGLVTPQNSSSM